MSLFAHAAGRETSGNSPLRVVQLVKGLGPGGAERLVLTQIETSSGEIDYCVVRLIGSKNHLVEAIERSGASTETIGEGLVWPLRLRRLLRQIQPDVIHVHSPVLAAAVRVLAKLGQIDAKIVTTEHNRWPRHHVATRLANRLTAPVDDVRFAVSNDVLDTMDARLQESTMVLDHGVPLSRLQQHRFDRDRYRDEFAIDPQTFVVGIVANFRPEKAYDVFLEAAIEALRQNPKMHFLVIGQGPGEVDFRTAVSAAYLDRDISVLGYREDAVAAMSSFDVFTLTSRHEGKPVSIMEAMALGLPIVSTRAGGIPEAVTDGVNGLLVDIGDAAGLAAGWVKLSEDQALRTSMAEASLAGSSKFDASRSTRLIESAYQGASGTTT